MKTERYTGEDGSFRCFGFPNTFVGKQGAIDILKEVPGIEISYFTKHFSAELIAEFKLNGISFELTEPYSDNSYFDIVCAEPDTNELEQIYQHFSSVTLPVKAQKLRYVKYGVPLLLGAMFCWYFLV